MSYISNAEYDRQRAQGEADRRQNLPPAPSAPSNPQAPYNKGYNGK